MITLDTFRQMALSFPGTEENPHFNRVAFKVTGKRIFVTLHEGNHSANFRFSVADQFVFCEYNKEAVFPVPNKWGEHGWTTVDLTKVPREFVQSALEAAYNESLKSGKGSRK